MRKRLLIILFSTLTFGPDTVAMVHDTGGYNFGSVLTATSTPSQQFLRAAALLDASLYSLNALHALIKKEHYRNKIASFNNPASSDLGFNLETEIQVAVKPILAKAKHISPTKFNEILRSFMLSSAKGAPGKTVWNAGVLYQTVFSVVGSLALGEKRVMKEDVDSFVLTVSKYFAQYQKLDRANEAFDLDIIRLSTKLEEIQFDVREHLLDLISLLYPGVNRSSTRAVSLESLQLQYLDPTKLQAILDGPAEPSRLIFPPDALKSAKDIAYGIQKLFNEYQKTYEANYKEISNILQQSRPLANGATVRQLNDSIRDLEQLYTESKQADVLTLRLHTLFERVHALTAAGQGGE